MDIISAYREVGSYRGAAAICETTPKTVRRVIERHEAGDGGPERKPRERNYDPEVMWAVLAWSRGSLADCNGGPLGGAMSWLDTATVTAQGPTVTAQGPTVTDDTTRDRGLLHGHQRGPHLATREDLYLANTGDFFVAMDNPGPHRRNDTSVLRASLARLERS